MRLETSPVVDELQSQLTWNGALAMLNQELFACPKLVKDPQLGWDGV